MPPQAFDLLSNFDIGTNPTISYIVFILSGMNVVSLSCDGA